MVEIKYSVEIRNVIFNLFMHHYHAYLYDRYVQHILQCQCYLTSIEEMSEFPLEKQQQQKKRKS